MHCTTDYWMIIRFRIFKELLPERKIISQIVPRLTEPTEVVEMQLFPPSAPLLIWNVNTERLWMFYWVLFWLTELLARLPLKIWPAVILIIEWMLNERKPARKIRETIEESKKTYDWIGKPDWKIRGIIWKYKKHVRLDWNEIETEQDPEWALFEIEIEIETT